MNLGVSSEPYVAPAVFTDLTDDLAVEVSLAMRRKGLRLCDLQRYGYSKTRIKEISSWLRGNEDAGRFGAHAALRLAEHLGIPVRILVGREAVPTRRRIAA